MQSQTCSSDRLLTDFLTQRMCYKIFSHFAYDAISLLPGRSKVAASLTSLEGRHGQSVRVAMRTLRTASIDLARVRRLSGASLDEIVL